MTEAKPEEKIFADSGNRAAAFLLDFFLVAFAAAPIGELLPYAFPLLALAYFVGMPLTPLQGTLGKWICRIKLCDRHGGRLTWRASLLRVGAQAAWCALPLLLPHLPSLGVDVSALSANWWVLFVLPWAPAAFMPRRETAFDLLAGSLVVWCKADAQSIGDAAPVRRPGLLGVASTLVFCLAVGALLSIAVSAGRDRNLHSRVAYAVEQTLPARQKIVDFHDRRRRWPAAAEIGIAEWTPYPDGGGYRVQSNGAIVITFSVLPELKGRSITFRPTRTEEGIRWLCEADAALKSFYLPGSCRLNRQ